MHGERASPVGRAIAIALACVCAMFAIAGATNATTQYAITDAMLFGLMPDPGWEVQAPEVVYEPGDRLEELWQGLDAITEEESIAKPTSDQGRLVQSQPATVTFVTSTDRTITERVGKTYALTMNSGRIYYWSPTCPVHGVNGSSPLYYAGDDGLYHRTSVPITTSMTHATYQPHYTTSPVYYYQTSPTYYYGTTQPYAAYVPGQPVRNIGRSIYNARTSMGVGSVYSGGGSGLGWSSGSYGGASACAGSS